jgi:hypothetical protein
MGRRGAQTDQNKDDVLSENREKIFMNSRNLFAFI